MHDAIVNKALAKRLSGAIIRTAAATLSRPHSSRFAAPARQKGERKAAQINSK
jgi:hypothetical protein